jgi:hypothetical protein
MAMALPMFTDFGPFYGEFVESELGHSLWLGRKKIKDLVSLTMGQSPKSEFYNIIKEVLSSSSYELWS